jgi:hypothetical protein
MITEYRIGDWHRGSTPGTRGAAGKNSRLHFRSSMKTFGHWRSVARQIAGQWARFPTRSACLAAGKWRRSAKPCFAMTDQCIVLDGAGAETAAAEPRYLATKYLAQLSARTSAKKAAEAATLAAVKPKRRDHAPASAPPTNTPEQLRDRMHAALSRRRA